MKGWLPGVCGVPFSFHMQNLSSEVSGRVAFHYPNFRFYMTARLLVITSSEMQALAVAWQVYNLTHRPLDLGLVGLAQFLPGVLLFLVAEEHFPNAVAWSVSVFQMATIVGPMLGGVLYGLLDSPVPVYLAAAVAGLTGLALVSAIHVAQPQWRRSAAPLGEVLNGLRYIWSNPIILGSISLDLFAVLLGGAVALLPVYAREILRVGSTGLGLLRSAPGVGAVITAVVLAHLPLRRRAGATMLWSVAGFGAATVVFGLSRSFALSLAALTLTGACDMVSVMVRHTLIQLRTPDAMRGRVSAVNMVFIGASNEVGQFESGLTAQWFGAVPAAILGGVGSIAVVAMCAWRFSELRRVDELTP
jgi:MFS family permease